MKKSLRMLAVSGAATTLALIPAAAQAVPLDVEYDASGSVTIASTGSTIDIAPTTLSTTIESAGGPGSLTGSLPLAPSRVEFKSIGFVPVEATVSYEEAAPITGQLVRDGLLTRVEATASYFIKLSDVRIAGLPAFVGSHCQTRDPVQIPANTPDGETFNIVTGGTLAGEFSIGNFEHCGLNTLLINLIIPGDGNTVQLDVSNGRLG